MSTDATDTNLPGAEWTFGSAGFAKLYGDRLAESSLLECAVCTRWVFLFMLARADYLGRFRCATVPGLARAAAVSQAEVEIAVRELEAPDPDSTTEDHEGRRIIRIPGGWQIVTYVKYREYQTKAQRAEAAKKRRQREAEAERKAAEEEAEGQGQGGHVPGRPGDVPGTSPPKHQTTDDVKQQTTTTTATAQRPEEPRPDDGPSPKKQSKRSSPPTPEVDQKTTETITRFEVAFRRAFNRPRASLPPHKAVTFAERLSAYPAEFMAGLPVAVVAAGLSAGRQVEPEYLLRDGSGSYTRGGETRATFDWMGSAWQAKDHLTLTPKHAAILDELGVLAWWKENGASVQTPEGDEC